MTRARLLLVVAILFGLSRPSARAQDPWTHTPYELLVYLATAPRCSLTPDSLQAIAQHLAERADTVVGAGWKLRVATAPPELAKAMADGFDAVQPEHVPLPTTEPDKVILLSIADGPRAGVAAREFDCRARRWGALCQRETTQPWRLPREAFLALTEAFTPIARVEPLEDKQARLKLRAAEFDPRDPAFPWVAAGDLFRCVLRVNDRSGTSRPAQDIPWTLLEVAEVQRAGALCRLEAGIRGALSARHGRADLLALGVRSAPGPTRLEVRSRTPDARPLTGYDVYATDSEGQQIERIGRTNRQGFVTIPPGPKRYRILLIRDGEELLARLPIVPGEPPTLTARIPDDQQRLEVEAFVVGLQESVVDLVARRAVLLARAEARLDANDVAEAEKLIEQVRRMETREQLRQRIEVERRRFASGDPTVQRKIDRLFDDTAKLLGRYLNPADVELLQRRLREARTAAAAAK